MLFEQRQNQPEYVRYVVFSRRGRCRRPITSAGVASTSISISVGDKESRQIVPRQPVSGKQLLQLLLGDLGVLA
jgi:hypothetical protein